jgi:2-polyprenyl-6-methoxyphenol hydroxylase-like FAD-dependent oxidoreductase
VTRKLRIILIGGGLAGLAAGIALSRRGFEIRIFDQSNEIKEVGAGITMTPNAVKILRALGLEVAAARCGVEPDAIVTRDRRSGAELSRLPAKGGTATRYGADTLLIHRADLRGLLLAALPAGVLQLGARCTSVRSDPRGAVAEFGGGRQEEADAIVGCDGIHSVVRDSLFGAQPARFTGNMCWRALIPTAVLPPNHVPCNVTIWMGRHGHIVTYCVRGGDLLNVVAIREAKTWVEESWSIEGQPSDMIAAYPDAHHELRLLLERVPQCFKWGLFDRDPLARWTEGRVTMLGDAAHPMLPFLGQGAAMGFEDAYVLARELARAGSDVRDALTAYECERRPRTAQVQFASRAQGESYHLHSPLARLRRRLGTDRTEQQAVNLLSKNWIFDYDPIMVEPGVSQCAAPRSRTAESRVCVRPA